MIEWAQKYLSLGWSVIPTWWITQDGVCACAKSNKCDAPGKHPIYSWTAFQHRLPTYDEVDKWWKTYPQANIAIITGSISGLSVIDTDRDDIDLESKTLVSKTGGGGRHYYYANDLIIPNAVGILNRIDIRSEGGYVIAPPSNHKSGNVYGWIQRTVPEKLPNSLCLLIDKKPGPKLIEEGERNSGLASLSGTFIRLGASETEATYITSIINSANCNPPLPYNEVEVIVKSIYSGHVKRYGTNGATEESAFRVITTRDMVQRYGGREDDWLIDGWLPNRTCGLIIAPPGNFKTWMLIDLAVSVATGRPFMRKFPVESTGPVLIIQQEDPHSMLTDRLASILGIGEITQNNDSYSIPIPPEDLNIYWHCDRKLHFANKTALAGFTDVIASIRPKLVVLDPLYSAINLDDYGTSGAQSMLMFKQLRDAYGCSFMIAHHTSKSTKAAERERDKLWGSQFLNAWLETGWQIKTIDEGTVCINRNFKMTEGRPSVIARIDISQYDYDITVADDISELASVGDPQQTEMQILALIETNKISSLRQIQHKLNLHGLGSISRVVKKHGIVKNDNGLYKMP